MIKRPKLPGGEMDHNEIISHCPERLIDRAKRENKNIVVSMKPMIEFDPTGQIIETYRIPGMFRLVDKRKQETA